MGEILVGDMSYENHGTVSLDEKPVCYGRSRLPCRGPIRTTSDPYLAVLGGTETYGKFVSRPFAALLEDKLGAPCVNLGSVNAGVDSFVNDVDLSDMAMKARFCVVQVMGAQNLSNRLYRVHSRRNDRFLAASEVLNSIYEDVDFTEFSFNKHMLGTLKKLDINRFDVVQKELKKAWLGRMKVFLDRFPRKPALLWLRYEDAGDNGVFASLGPRPPLVTQEMIDALASRIDGVVEVPVQAAKETGDLMQMTFPSLQIAAAEQMLGPDMHEKIANALSDYLSVALNR